MTNKRKSIGKKLRFDVLHRDGFTCQYCGSTPPEVVLHLDHRLPVVEGGKNTLENLITSCAPCNIGKGVTVLSMSANPSSIRKEGHPEIEFFWHSDWLSLMPEIEGNRSIEHITSARIADFPTSFDSPEYYSSDYRRWCDQQKPYFSTFGASSRGFSNHLAATKVFDLLGSRWLTSAAYVTFLDDVLMFAEAGKLPQYVAPMVMRATHPENCYSQCLQKNREYEDQMDAIAAQAQAVFRSFLASQHNQSVANND